MSNQYMYTIHIWEKKISKQGVTRLKQSLGSKNNSGIEYYAPREEKVYFASAKFDARAKRGQ